MPMFYQYTDVKRQIIRLKHFCRKFPRFDASNFLLHIRLFKKLLGQLKIRFVSWLMPDDMPLVLPRYMLVQKLLRAYVCVMFLADSK